MCRVIFILFYFLRTSSARRGEGGGALPDFCFCFFPCSADHKRDWPPCKVVFQGSSRYTFFFGTDGYGFQEPRIQMVRGCYGFHIIAVGTWTVPIETRFAAVRFTVPG